MPGAYKKYISATLTLLLCFLVAEGGARLFWHLKAGVPFWQSAKIIYAFYPELAIFEEDLPNSEDDGEFDVLILGGSTLSRHYNTDWFLMGNLAPRVKNRKIRIYNVAEAAHTSLDSYYKYRYLKNRQFDLVIVYDGINEVRADNVPPELFRKDYSHFWWYRFVNAFGKHPEIRFTALPFTLHYATITAAYKMGFFEDKNVPKNTPRGEWLRYGSEIKTAASPQENLEKILRIAREKNEAVLLMTFGYYVPANYSYDRFKSKSLDYGRHLYPIEIWGSPINVIKGLEIHNRVIRGIAKGWHRNVLFIDTEKELPQKGQFFDDIAHFSASGMQAVTAMIASKVSR